MIPYIAYSYGTRFNIMLEALWQHIKSLRPDLIDSPVALEDQISEWLGINAHRYRRCRANAVVMVHRHWKGHPALRVFYEHMDGVSLTPVLVIFFKEESDQ